MKKCVKSILWFGGSAILVLLVIVLIMYSIPHKKKGSFSVFSLEGVEKTFEYDITAYKSLFLKTCVKGKVVLAGKEYADENSVYKMYRSANPNVNIVGYNVNILDYIDIKLSETESYVFRVPEDISDLLWVVVDNEGYIEIAYTEEPGVVYYGPADSIEKAEIIFSKFMEVFYEEIT